MIGIAYSSIGIIAIIIHCIINKDILFIGSQEKLPERLVCYRKFLIGILVYFITDSLWGILDEFKLLDILRIDTIIYYISMAVVVVLWCDYVVFYLKHENVFGKLIKIIGRLFVVFEIAALIYNFFNPIFFYFDEAGTYHAGSLRYLAFYIQIALFIMSVIQQIVVTVSSEGAHRRHHLAMCLFGISITMGVVLQIHYPLLPIYAIGFLIGVCFLHVYVEEDEKDENYENLKRQMDIISSMSGVYFCSYYVDIANDSFIEIDNKIAENTEFIGKSGVATETLEKMCKELVLPEFANDMREFTRLDNLDERMCNKKYYISQQFKSLHTGWAEGYFVAGDKDENGKLKHVIWAIRIINDEKDKEEKLLYNSYIDELTGLYNRKMYSNDIGDNKDNSLSAKVDLIDNDDFVFVSMDVNGLKQINDTQGHAAGDELIKGAAKCMKECMGKYGRIYRTGGDEFIALLNITKEQLELLKEEFNDATANYRGKFIDGMSVSCGFVVKKDNPDLEIDEIEKLADKNMYLAKRAHYAARGMDRRTQHQNAYKALCALYNKILLVNFTEDKYSIIFMDESEQIEEKGFSDGIFDWLENFAKKGQVHPDDVEFYLSKTNRKFINEYFLQDKTSLSFTYRRMTDGVFKMAEMEIIPSENYAEDNQNMYLYVKSIDK